MQVLEITFEKPNRWTFVTSAALAPMGFVDFETDRDGRGLSVTADFAEIAQLLDPLRCRLPFWPRILSVEDFAIPHGASIASCVAKLDAAWQHAGLGLVYAEPSVFPAIDQAACLTGTCEFRCHSRMAAGKMYCELGGIIYCPERTPGEARIQK